MPLSCILMTITETLYIQYITSSLNDEELAVLQGQFSLLFISQEQLLTRGKWREMLRSDVY